MLQFSHPYMITGKTIALTRWTFVGKVMSLLFNMLSGFVIAFLPRSKCLLISWPRSPSAVILEPQKIKSLSVSIVSPYLCHEVVGPDAMILVFWMLSFKPAFSLSSFTFLKRLFSSSLLSAIRVVSSAYLRLLIFLPAFLIPACASSSLAFCIMYSRYKLNKQGDNIQPWRTPFPIWNQSVVPCPVLTVASWPAYRFLRRQVRWSGITISLRIFKIVVIHTVKGFGVVNKAEVDVFFWNSLAFLMVQQMSAIWSLVPLLFLNPAWTSGSSQFMNYWSLVWRILSITLLVCEMSGIVRQFEHFLALSFFGVEMKTDLFQSCGHCWVFQICWHIECSTFTASSFRIWNSSAGIPSLPLALFVVMLPKATQLCTPRCLALGEWSHGHENLFCIVLPCILATFS